MPYTQGWLIGVSIESTALIPFELIVLPGRGAHSVAGPVNDNLMQSFLLAWSALDVCLARLGKPPAALRGHLHLPLQKMVVTGPSCRLSFINALLYAVLGTARYPPASAAVTGDINVTGNVLGVADVCRKVEAARQANFWHVIVPQTPDTAHLTDVIRVDSVMQLLRDGT